MKSKNGLSARLTAPTLRVEYIITQAIDIPPGRPGGERSDEMRRVGKIDTNKRTQRYNELEEGKRWKHKICALYLAGVEKKEIANQLSVSTAIVDVYVDRLKEEIINAKS